ncbi:MAG TPA: hypothetical protein VG387_16720 [Rhizomicrobium sp.]|nr:hypothetical protein [Rhizomicrobium sp.]
MRIAFVAILISLLDLAAPARAADCSGPAPVAAVTTLPAPLDTWGTVGCTPYGYVIANHPGWIWSEPGGYLPVYIPAQMVAKDPRPLGNTAYFTAIIVTKSAGADYAAAYAAYAKGFAPDAKKPDGYRLEATSVLGTKLTLFFFDYGDHAWGIWCGMGKFACNPDTRFMLLGPRKAGGGG